jgi:hypothetical protein
MKRIGEQKKNPKKEGRKKTDEGTVEIKRMKFEQKTKIMAKKGVGGL